MGGRQFKNLGLFNNFETYTKYSQVADEEKK